MDAPDSNDELGRLAALHSYQILDTAPEESYDGIVKLAAFICGTPMSSVTLIDADRQWFKAEVGMLTRESPRDIAFCAQTILKPETMVVVDATQDPRFAENPLVTGEPHIRFYAGVPLLSPDGYALGSLCVIDRQPRELSQDQLDALELLARQVSDQMEFSRQAAIRASLELEREQAYIDKIRSDERFQAAFYNAPLGASIADADGHYVAVNQAFCRITGYSQDELLSAGFQNITHPDDVAESVDKIAALRSGQIQSFVLDKRYIHKDGRIVWVSLSVTLTRDETGQPHHTLAMSEDITLKKIANELHREAQERTANLLSISSELGTAITTGQVTDVILRAALPYFHASMGLVAVVQADEQTLSAVQIVGIPPAISGPWKSFDINGDFPIAQAVREQRLVFVPQDDVPLIRHPNLAGIVCAVPLMVGERCIGGIGMVCPDNRILDEEQQTFLWTVAGQCALALERARLYDDARHEVEERQRAEQFARGTLNGLSTAIAILDGNGVILAVNDTWRNACVAGGGIQSLVSEGTNYLDVCDNAIGVESDDSCNAANGIRSVAAGEQDLFVMEYPCHSPDTERWFNLRATRFPGNGTARVVVSHEDITARKLVEYDLERTLQEAEARADRDPLTGLLNHRAFHNHLDIECARAARENTSLAVVMMDLDNFKFFNDVYGHATGDGVLRLVASKLSSVSRSYDILARFGGDEFAMLLPSVRKTTASEVEARLRGAFEGLTFHSDEQHGEIPISITVGTAIFPDSSLDSHEVLRHADDRLRRAKTGGDAEETADKVRADAVVRVAGFSMLDALVTAVDNKDRYTRRHSEDVMEYSLMIARELGLDEATQQTVAVSALLHDVGKVGVPDKILRKPGKLTDSEFEAIRQHPQMGAIIVGAVQGLEDTLDAVRHHHERWDGGGYPAGLAGESIPLMARLMAVADAFSAMTTDRPYRKGMRAEDAISILEVGAGSQWDKLSVDAFVRALGARKVGTVLAHQ